MALAWVRVVMSAIVAPLKWRLYVYRRGNAVVLGEPIEGREAAARRWRVAFLATFFGGMVGGLLAAIGGVLELPSGLVVVGLLLLAIALLGALFCTVGMGWTRNLPWHQSNWLGVRAVRSTICAIF